MEMSLERINRNGRWKFQQPRSLFGRDFCKTTFLNYELRRVKDIWFLGEDTITATTDGPNPEWKIPEILQDECERIRGNISDSQLIQRWKENNYQLIVALCRSQEETWGACTKALIKYIPKNLKLVRKQPSSMYETLIDYFFNKYFSKKFAEEQRILTTWAQYWN